MSIDLRFIDSEYPFLVLVNLVELVDQNMPSIIQEEVKRIEEKYKDGGENWLEKESDIQALDQFIYEDFPRFFFGSMLIALWSSFEAALYELAKYIRGFYDCEGQNSSTPGEKISPSELKIFLHYA